MNFVFRLNFRLKFAIILMTAVFLTASGMGFYSVRNMMAELKTTVLTKLDSDTKSAFALIDTMYPGPWSVQPDGLYKGTHLVSGDMALVDKLSGLTGDSVTIFLDDKRVATTVINENGQRATGSQMSPEVADLVLKGGKTFRGEAKVLNDTYQAHYEPIKNLSGKVIGAFYVGAPHTAYRELVSTFQWNLIIFMLIMQLMANVMAWYIAKFFGKPINQLESAMANAANGDLSQEVQIKSKDEFGDLAKSFNVMLHKISSALAEVVHAAKSVAHSAEQLSAGADQSSRATEQIASTIQQVAHGTDSQAKSVEETANNVQQMSQGATQIATNAHMVLEASEDALRAATVGGQVINESVQQMQAINATVGEFATRISSLGHKSDEIGKIVGLIAGIAKQTNLLALNAAIEAARAGEQGKGFAVVADEVRKLAEQSAEAATQIAGLVTEIQGETTKAVSAMETGMVEVNHGCAVVNRAGESFESILVAIHRVRGQIQEVSAATEQMAAGGHEVVLSIENIASISEETAASAQEVAVAAEEQTATIEQIAASANMLAKLAEDLKLLADRFRLE